jgi:hypothetical protein
MGEQVNPPLTLNLIDGQHRADFIPDTFATFDAWLSARTSLVLSRAQFDLYLCPILTADDARALDRFMDTRQRDARRSGYRFIDRYTKEILDGKWFDETTVLYCSREQRKVVDGQHRIISLIRASEKNPDVCFRDVLIRVIREEAVVALDRGRGRTQSDNLAFFAGAKIPNAVIKAIGWVEAGMPGDESIVTDSDEFSAALGCPHLPHVTALYKRARLRASGIIAAYVACRDANPEKADAFFGAISKGEALIGGVGSESAQALVKVLSSAAKQKSRTGAKNTFRRETAARCIQAYNAWATGKETSLSRYYASVSMPVPVGV